MLLESLGLSTTIFYVCLTPLIINMYLKYQALVFRLGAVDPISTNTPLKPCPQAEKFVSREELFFCSLSQYALSTSVVLMDL